MIKISGYASTIDKDRTNEVINSEAWVNGLANFQKNPVLLYQHDHSNPVGKVSKLTVDERGLFVEAMVSDTAGNLVQLIEEDILKAFSVGFQLREGEYDRANDIFYIKDAELLELSIVSIPCNPNALFEKVVG